MTPDTFPADHELLDFFGVEPTVLDPGVPWFYNSLRFEVDHEGTVARCTLEPASGDINVQLTIRGAEVARVSLRSFIAVKLHAGPSWKTLVASFGPERDGEVFGLTVRPRIWMGVGNFQSIPPDPFDGVRV